MGEIKLTSFRLDKDITDRFKAFCEENHLTVNQGFSNMMQALELNNAKTILTNRQTEIEHFQSLIHSLMSAFMNSLEINANAENRIRQDLDLRLDADAKTISNLQNENKQLKNQMETLKSDTVQLQKESEILIQQLDEKKRENQILKDTNDALNNALNAEKNLSASLQAEKAQELNNKQMLEQLQTELEQTKQHYESVIHQQNLQHLQEIGTLEKNLQTAHAQVELIQAQAEAEKVKAILEETSNLREKIEQLMQKQSN